MNDSNLTRNGIAYDLKLSPYKLHLKYKESEITFIFSSQLNVDRFKDKLNENRETINNSLSKRFGFSIVNNTLCDIKLYNTIEKRGFLIDYNKERFECLNTIKLDGMNLIIKS